MSKVYKFVWVAPSEAIDHLIHYITSAYKQDIYYCLYEVDIIRDQIYRVPMNTAYDGSDIEDVFEGLVFYAEADDRNNYFFTRAKEDSYEFCAAECSGENEWNNIVVYSGIYSPNVIRKLKKSSFEKFLTSDDFKKLEKKRQSALNLYCQYLNSTLGQLNKIQYDYDVEKTLSKL